MGENKRTISKSKDVYSRSQSQNYAVILLVILNSYFALFAELRVANASLLMISAMAAIPVLFVIINHRIRVFSFIMILFLIDLLLGLLFSINKSMATQFFLKKFCIIMTAIYLLSASGWENRYIRITLRVTLMFAVFGIIQYMLPSVVQPFIRFVLPSEAYNWNLIFSENGMYCGLAPQLSYQAGFVAMGIAAGISVILTENANKILIVAVTIVCFVALLLTQKRTPLYASIGGVLITISVMAVGNSKNKKTTALLCIAIVVLYFLLYKTTIGLAVVDRIKSDDLSGREEIWDTAIALWKKAPVFGIGTYNFLQYSKLSTHNAYLQLLCENGIIGLMLYLIIIISSWLKDVRLLINNRDTSNNRIKQPLIFALIVQTYFIIYGVTGSTFFEDTFFLPFVISLIIPYSVENEIINQIANNCSYLGGEYQ